MEENDRLQELMETKTFHELTSEEKSLVLKEMTEEEYTLRKSVIDQTRLFLKTEVGQMQPRTETLAKAAAILQSKSQNTKKRGLAAILTYRIPVFIPAAAAAVLLLILPFALTNKTETKYIAQAIDTVVKVVHKVDTVVKEKETFKTVYVPVKTYVQVPSAHYTVSHSSKQGTDRVVSTDPQTILQETTQQLKKQSNQTGLSSKDTDALGILIRMKDTLIYEP